MDAMINAMDQEPNEKKYEILIAILSHRGRF